MIQVPEHIAIIIIKHLRAIQNSTEEKELQDWVNESEEHKMAYEEMIRLWHESGSVMELPAFDTDSAWEKLDSTLASGAVAPRGVKIVYRRLALAACLVGVLALASLIFYQLRGKTVVKIAEAGKGSQQLTLPDGSTVILREGASIRYPDSFTGSERAVAVSGEAYFDVQPETSHPFRIRTSRATIEVLGTSFIVNSNDRQDRLVVVSGRVLFTGKNKRSEQHIITAQQDATLDKEGFNIVTVKDSNYLSWQTGILQFDNTPFAEVMTALSDYYNVQVKAEATLTTRPELSTITARFERQPLEQVLEEIKLLINVDYRKQNDTIIFFKTQ